MRAVRMMVIAVGLAGVLLSTGCTDPQALQIAGLQRDNNELRKENAQLKNQLNDLLVRLKKNDRDLQALRDALEAAKGQLATLQNLPNGWNQEGGVAWIDVGEDVLFDSGKAAIRPQGISKLREIAGTIKGDPELSKRAIYIVGHTDSDPIKVTKDKWIDNLDLSINRGAAVTREFYKLGLDPKDVVAAGQGEHNPKAPNDTKANKQINRRVQIMAVVRPPTSGENERRAAAVLESPTHMTPTDSLMNTSDAKPDSAE